MLVAVFPEFLRNGFGAITTVAFNHTQIAILIFSDNRKLSLGHDVLPSWFDSFPTSTIRTKTPIRADSDRHPVCAVNSRVQTDPLPTATPVSRAPNGTRDTTM